MMAIPDDLKKVIEFTDYAPAPILKDGATDKQKIIYADFITELFKDKSFDDEAFDKMFK